MNPSEPSLPHGDTVVYGIFGRLSKVAFGCRISYKNSGIIGTVLHRIVKSKKNVNVWAKNESVYANGRHCCVGRVAGARAMHARNGK